MDTLHFWRRSTWKQKIELSASRAKSYLEETSKKNRVLLAYISAYGYTREMAMQVKEGLLKSGNLEVDMVDIENMLLGDLEGHLVRADGLLVGSPTINQNTLLPVYKLFAVCNPIIRAPMRPGPAVTAMPSRPARSTPAIRRDSRITGEILTV